MPVPLWPTWVGDPGNPSWSYTRYEGYTYRVRELIARLIIDRQPQGSDASVHWECVFESAALLRANVHADLLLDIRNNLPVYATLGVL